MSEDIVGRKQKFCDELKTAREYKKLDLVRIAERSKISYDYLEKLESGDWEFLPQAYIRSFLLTYAQLVGMEVNEVLQEFDTLMEEPSIAKQYAAASEESFNLRRKAKKTPVAKTESESFESSAPSAISSILQQPVYWILGVVVIVIAVFIIYNLPGKEKQPEVQEIPLEEVVKDQQDMIAEDDDQSPTDSEESSSSSQDAVERVEEKHVAAQPAGKLTLVTKATDKCYVRISADRLDNILDDVVLIKGFTRTYEADSLFVVVLGNAGGMELILNGRNLGELGETGRVVTITLGPEGLRHLRRGRRVQPSPPPEQPATESNASGTQAEPGDTDATENQAEPAMVTPDD